jgi:hypothetical protein
MNLPRILDGAARAFPWLMLLGAASLGSCGAAPQLSGAHRLRITLPEAPASWAFLPDLRMALSWRGPGGGILSAPASPGGSMEIEVERGRPQELLALPSSAGRALRPAGALYPEALASAPPASGALTDELALDWLGGYLAYVALALEGAGIDPRTYDLDRLSREAASRSGDPWVLPAGEVAARLVEGGFRASAFDDPERRRVALPGEGPWAPESPFAAAPAPAAGSEAGIVADLPVGLWRFVGIEEELIVSLEGNGCSTWVIRPARALRGASRPSGTDPRGGAGG